MAEKLFSPAAEADVIGHALFDSSTRQVFDLLPAHFGDPVHAAIWAVMDEIAAQGRAISYPAIKAALRGHTGLASLDAAAGGDYLFHLIDKAPPLDAALDSAQVVRDEWLRRQTAYVSQQAIAMATAATPRPALDVIAFMRKAIDELETEAGAANDDFQTASTAAASVVRLHRERQHTGVKPGRMTGLRCIDHRLGGFHPGELVILGGRPSMGKTALGRAIAHGCAVHNPDAEVIVFDIEMGSERMMERELSALTYEAGFGVEYGAMARGDLSQHDVAAMDRAQAQVPNNLILRDDSGISVDDVRRALFTRRRRTPVALVVIDYLQLMRRPAALGRNDAAVLGEMTSALKRLARQAGCAILLLSQLSRQVEAREDKRPLLSDLRESGSIEQDADAVLFVYREAYYLERAKPRAGQELGHDMRVADFQRMLEIICAKNRRGAVGIDRQLYRAEYDHISNEAA